MNLKELSSPIRVYWDIAPEHASIDYKGISDQIATNRILSLQLSDSGPVLSNACLTILETLKDRPLAISLVASRKALTASILARLQTLPVRVLFVSAASCSELETVLEVKEQIKGKPLVGVSFSVTRNNYRDLPDVLSFCSDHGIANLVLPMQRLMNETECFSLSSAERHTLSEQVQQVLKPDGMKIIIHDPFLWRTFYPTVDFPDGGCQAANTMIYISPEADVYPCPSLPVKIGNLTEESLREIICSGRKKDLRNILITVPIDGTACDRAASCLGACRGRAFVMTGSLTCCDPACE